MLERDMDRIGSRCPWSTLVDSASVPQDGKSMRRAVGGWVTAACVFALCREPASYGSVIEDKNQIREDGGDDDAQARREPGRNAQVIPMGRSRLGRWAGG